MFKDSNEDGVRQSSETGMSGISITIEGEEVSKRIETGPNGSFIVDLSPGQYTLELVKTSLPERYELTTPGIIEVTARKFGRTEVTFGTYQKPKPVVVTFGPPTARISHSPEKPVVDEKIILDGSDSTAINTDIETYKWKFVYRDTEMTRTGKIVELTPDKPGSWEVTSTVTDGNGLKGQAVKTIDISAD